MNNGLAIDQNPGIYQAVFDALDDGVSIHDLDSGRVLEANPAMRRMFGYGPEETCDLTVERYCLASKPLSTAAALSFIRATLAKGIRRCEWRTRDKNGHEFWINVQLKSFNLDGKERLLIIARNPTPCETLALSDASQPCPERCQYDVQNKSGAGPCIGHSKEPVLDFSNSSIVEQSSAKPNDFRAPGRPSRPAQRVPQGSVIGAIAHGLNNSLTPILGYASEARAMASEPAMAHCLDETLKACRKARDLTSSLLTIGRVGDSGRKSLELWPTLENSLQAVCALLPSGVSLDVQENACRIVVVASPGDVQELILYLCMIALQSLPGKRGNLTMRLEPGSNASGCRISLLAKAGKTQNAVEPDRRSSVLAAARDLARYLGGNLTLSPRSDGLEISIHLPGMSGSAQAEPRPHNLGHVLFIDDDKAIANLVCKQLSSAGYRVTAVSDSDEGLRRFSLAPKQFDCVVTDLLMPGLSGQMLALRIRELRPEVPVLLCSGNCDLDNVDESSAQCFAGYIPKPFSKRELTQAVSMALARTATVSDERDKV